MPANETKVKPLERGREGCKYIDMGSSTTPKLLNRQENKLFFLAKKGRGPFSIAENKREQEAREKNESRHLVGTVRWPKWYIILSESDFDRSVIVTSTEV